MERTELKEDMKTGLFWHADGRTFVRCEYTPDAPVWIDVTGSVWTAIYLGGLHTLDWNRVDVPKSIIFTLKSVINGRMKTRDPSYFPKVANALNSFFKIAKEEQLDLTEGFSGLNISSFLRIWDGMVSSSRSFLRDIYVECADKKIAGADYAIAREIKTWNARTDIVQLRDVIQWHPNAGAFISAEWEIVRGILERWNPDEHPHDIASKIFGRILTETLKRPSQVTSMPKDALWVVQSPDGKGPDEFFLRIPMAKAQAGGRPATWQITASLGRAIQEYSLIPSIRALQEQIDRLVVIPLRGRSEGKWVQRGQIDPQTAKQSLQELMKRNNIISPRTNEPINLTPYRIRHTGGTAMAMQGIPRDEIQEILEHKSLFTADAYIQAVGSDLLPALERSTDRGVGEVFTILSEAYFFKGAVVDELRDQWITIPTGNIEERVANELQTPAVVGSCGKDGACTKHPFWACYNGCPHFLAWKDGDHRKSLAYVDSELKRWNRAEGGKERSKLHKDFDRIGAAIREVVQQTEELGEGAST
jgi:hypothetical protein